MMRDRAQIRRTRRGARFFDDPTANPGCLGCSACSEFSTCGGLHVRAAAFDCLAYCCRKPLECDNVCVRNPSAFVERVHEIGGFSLENIPRTAIRSRPVLPRTIPLVYHGSSRSERFASPVVALPLFALISRSQGTVRFASRAELLDTFRLSDSSKIVLSGTDTDAPLERWWGYGGFRRIFALEHLMHLGIEVITSPNYSLFSDAPRWTDLHSMKRIAITWQEIADVGISSALHVNARTIQDWRRWRDFIGERQEINCLAFEFATGAADPKRMVWHTDQLCRLAAEVQRPITLFIRGGTAVLPQLEEFFDEVCLIDPRPFMKAIHRQEAVRRSDGTIAWRRASSTDSPVDELLEHNSLALAASLSD
jgi:hypothetical protein